MGSYDETRGGSRIFCSQRSPHRIQSLAISSSFIAAICASVILTSSVWVFRCASILFISIYENFGATREEAAWPITAFFVASSFSGAFDIGLKTSCIPDNWEIETITDKLPYHLSQDPSSAIWASGSRSGNFSCSQHFPTSSR